MSDFDPEAALITAQLRHTVDLLRMENEKLRTELNHHRELSNHRLEALEKQHGDQESRLRSVQDSATQFKMLAGLATGGGLLSLIALLKALSGA